MRGVRDRGTQGQGHQELEWDETEGRWGWGGYRGLGRGEQGGDAGPRRRHRLCWVPSETEQLLSRGPRYSMAEAAPGPGPAPVPAEEREEEQEEREELELRRRLKYFFVSPFDKSRACGRWPVKLRLQLAKVILVTIQVTAGTAGTLGMGGWDSREGAQRHGDIREGVSGHE